MFIGISGSLRKDSYNRKLLVAAGAFLPAGTPLELLDIGALPLFNQDQEADFPPVARAYKDKIRAAKGILIATPEYNRSVPGVLKNAIDWTSRPYGDNAWKGKKVLVMGATGGSISTALAQYDLKKILLYLDAEIQGQPEIMIGSVAERMDQNGSITDEKTRRLLQEAVERFVSNGS